MKDYFAEYGAHKKARGRLSSPSLKRTFLFAIQSVRVRLGRCLITAASIICAIAFLTYNSLSLEELRKIEASESAETQPTPAGETDFFERMRDFTSEAGRQQKMLFVTALSVLVCMAGITNSMMMSIKERYREIATLKCLGAVNSYVMRMFLIEASLQGVLGSVAGIALGMALFALGRGALPSAGYVLLVSGVCFALGCVMTLLSALWPIRAALAMLPVEALRVVE